MVVHDYGFAWRLLRGGDIGIAESYLRGEWETPNLTEFLYLFCVNVEMMQAILRGKPLVRWAQVFRHWLNRNTRRQARKNIHAHYDLGNDFYRAWLDPTMTYSSALFDQGSNDLSAAQLRKYESLAQQIDLKPGQNVLEIGCGWGGFAEYAAKTYGANVTGLTISQEQHDYARKRMFDAGLADQVTIKMQDYRDETGIYDRIASIEMIEAVGEQFWPDFFRQMSDRLVAGGDRRHPGHHHPGALLSQLPARDRLHPPLRVSRRHAALAHDPEIARLEFRHSAGARKSVRRRLCAHAVGMARPFPRGVALAGAARFRRAFPPAVGILPRLLRGRLPVAEYRCAADDFRQAGVATGHTRFNRPTPCFFSLVAVLAAENRVELRILIFPISLSRRERACFRWLPKEGAERRKAQRVRALARSTGPILPDRPRLTALHCGVFNPWGPASLCPDAGGFATGPGRGKERALGVIMRREAGPRTPGTTISEIVGAGAAPHPRSDSLGERPSVDRDDSEL